MLHELWPQHGARPHGTQPSRITKTSFATKLPPRCRRHPDATAPHPPINGNNRKDGTVRNTLIALAAATGLTALGSVTASAAPVIAPAPTAQNSAIQQADYYCGPRCQYWHHRRWEEHHAWRYYRHGYYGYNYPYTYYYR
jgi:hypothetical protein